MITNITLENFKCFRKVEVNPRRITAFVGPNGTGKSSVLQALALLKQSDGGGRLQTQGSLLNLGDYQSLVPKSLNVPVTVHLGFGGVGKRPDLSESGFDEEVNYEYRTDFLGARLTSHYGRIMFSFLGHPSTIENSQGAQYSETVPIGNHSAVVEGDGEIGRVVHLGGWAAGAPNPLVRNGLTEVLDTPRFVLRKLRFVNAARGLVQHSYRLEDSQVEDFSLAGGLSQQERQLATNLGYSRIMEAHLSNLLKKVTGVGLRVNTIPPQSVEVNAVAPAGDVNIVAEGFGTNALIQLFWQLDRAEKDATVLIEEPEIHLHPKAQAELASVLVEEAQAEDKQIIMTTHSEHILGRLLTLVAEEQLAADELAIYAFEKDEKGECTASQLEITEDGRVVGGIKDFFESDLNELERYIKALQSDE